MDFVVGLLRVRSGYNALWVIIDWLTKSTHFILIKDNKILISWVGLCQRSGETL